MRQLVIFDDGVFMASITVIESGTILIFSRSSREWKDVNRWISQGFYRLDKKTDDYIKINPLDPEFLPQLAKRAHEFDFSTELTDINN